MDNKKTTTCIERHSSVTKKSYGLRKSNYWCKVTSSVICNNAIFNIIWNIKCSFNNSIGKEFFNWYSTVMAPATMRMITMMKWKTRNLRNFSVPPVTVDVSKRRANHSNSKNHTNMEMKSHNMKNDNMKIANEWQKLKKSQILQKSQNWRILQELPWFSLLPANDEGCKWFSPG